MAGGEGRPVTGTGKSLLLSSGWELLKGRNCVSPVRLGDLEQREP